VRPVPLLQKCQKIFPSYDFSILGRIGITGMAGAWYGPIHNEYRNSSDHDLSMGELLLLQLRAGISRSWQ